MRKSTVARFHSVNQLRRQATVRKGRTAVVKTGRKNFTIQTRAVRHRWSTANETTVFFVFHQLTLTIFAKPTLWILKNFYATAIAGKTPSRTPRAQLRRPFPKRVHAFASAFFLRSYRTSRYAPTTPTANNTTPSTISKSGFTAPFAQP